MTICAVVITIDIILWLLYNPVLVYCRELAPGTVSLTGDRAQGDDSKHDSHYSTCTIEVSSCMQSFTSLKLTKQWLTIAASQMQI